MSDYDELSGHYGRSPGSCSNTTAYGEIPPELRQQFLQQQTLYQLQLQQQVTGTDPRNPSFDRVIEAQLLAQPGRLR